MSSMLLVQFIFLVELFIFSAFFSSAETALFSLNPVHVHRIRKKWPAAAERIERMLAAPAKLLSTILIGNTIVNVTAAALSYAIAERLFPGRGEVISIPAMTLLILLFGEVTPKRLAMRHAQKIAPVYSLILSFLIPVATPIRFVLEKIAGLFKKEIHPARRVLTEDEFMTVVEVGEEEGVLDEEERTMVDRIIMLEDVQACDIMTPRVDLIGLDLEDPPEKHMQTARHVNFRFLPVYTGSIDRQEGFLDVPKFLLSEQHDLASAMIPAFFVPETSRLDTLLTTFQRERRRVAFVVDEFGGTAGLITRGDILEEIADDVDNEFGRERSSIQKTGENQWILEGSTSLEDVNYELDLNLEAEGADRIAGWVIAHAERLPRMGEVVEAQSCRVTVERTRRNRITAVRLEKLASQYDEEDED